MTATGPDEVERQGPAAWGHVPALDGVRGLAVIAVLLFHGGVSWAAGGFLGVDAFFVLSGLLITSLLIDEANRSGRVDLGRFWSRRARRLLPALLLVVAVAGLYGATLAEPGALPGLRRDALATLAYVSNWRFISAGADYFEGTAAPSVLRHTWSLAIEEQFYVAWPLIVLVLARLRGRTAAIAAVAGLGTVASAATMALRHQPGEDPSRVYFGTDTRVHVVLVGALLAAVVATVRHRHAELAPPVARALGFAAAAGAASWLVAVATVDGSELSLYRGGFLAVSLGVAALLAHVVLVPRGWSARMLAWRPLRVVGIVSYGLYLWHWPIYLTLTSARTGLRGPGLLALRLAATAAAAAVSYVAVEQPIRRGALPRWRAGLALPVAAAIALVVALLGTATPPVRATAASAGPDLVDGLPRPLRPPRPLGTPAKVLVVGDSVAKTLADRFARPARQYQLQIVNHGVLGCGVVRGSPFRYFGEQRQDPPPCATWPQRWTEHVTRDDPDVVLLIVGRWEVMDRFHAGRWRQLGDPVFDRYVEAELDRALRILTSRRALVAVATAPYFFRGERPDGGSWPEDDPARVDRYNAILRRVAERHVRQVTVLDLNERTSTGGRYTPAVDGVSLRYDGVHFSPQGAAWLAPWILDTLARLAPPGSARVRPTTTSTTPRPVTPTVPTTRPPRPTTTQAPTTTTEPPRDEPPSTTTPPSPTTTRPPVTLVP